MKDFVYSVGNIFLTLLVMLLIVLGFAFVELKMMLKPNIELFGYVLYLQDKDYMAGDFTQDDVIILTKAESVASGDIILYLDAENNFNISKIIGFNDNKVNTKCNTCNNTKVIETGQISAKAIGKIRGFGKVVNFFRNKVVLISIAVIGFVCIISSQYMNNRKSIKTRVDQV